MQKRSTELTADTMVLKTDWELYITQIATEITREQSPQRLVAARYVDIHANAVFICILIGVAFALLLLQTTQEILNPYSISSPLQP